MCDSVVVKFALILFTTEGLRAERLLTDRAFLFDGDAERERLMALRALLVDDSLCERVQVRVRLLQQMRDTRVLRSVDELHVRLFVVVLQRLETLLREPLDAPLLFLLCMCVQGQDSLPKP